MPCFIIVIMDGVTLEAAEEEAPGAPRRTWSVCPRAAAPCRRSVHGRRPARPSSQVPHVKAAVGVLVRVGGRGWRSRRGRSGGSSGAPLLGQQGGHAVLPCTLHVSGAQRLGAKNKGRVNTIGRVNPNPNPNPNPNLNTIGRVSGLAPKSGFEAKPKLTYRA